MAKKPQEHILKTITVWMLTGGLLLLSSCATLDPRKVDIELEESLPQMKVTSYTQALRKLGMMTEIYDTPEMKIQVQPVGDLTGTSASTGYEIPRDITEMLKTALNSIGGKVTFIPYDPSFMQSNVMTGYSGFANKVIPDVVLSGGITEFDRSLATYSENTDIGAGAEFNGLPKDMPSNAVEGRYGGGKKWGLARITLDFNLLDFMTMTGIPFVTASNSMQVRKALNSQEVGISLFGQSFGFKGNVKKVQGRHAAVRLLVELSAIQMIGKHLRLPYWRLLGEDTKPDRYVMEQIANYYRYMNASEIVAVVQGWLYLYGYDVEVTGQLNEKTLFALKQVCPDFQLSKQGIGFKYFTKIYLNIPISAETKRRMEMASWR